VNYPFKAKNYNHTKKVCMYSISSWINCIWKRSGISIQAL